MGPKGAFLSIIGCGDNGQGSFINSCQSAELLSDNGDTEELKIDKKKFDHPGSGKFCLRLNLAKSVHEKNVPF